MARDKMLVVVGTRPEAIKLAPVIEALGRSSDFNVRVCATAQHRFLLDQMLSAFSIRPNYDLNLMRAGQSPDEVAQRALQSIRPILRRWIPDMVIVQGDTTTAAAATLAAFYHRIPVAHVEAGLRSHDPANPYPEEKNRVMIDHLAELLFAPTRLAKTNLERENLSGSRIFLVGNTVVDALRWAGRRSPSAAGPFAEDSGDSRVILMTLHRRESFGAPLRGIFRAMLEVVRSNPRATVAYPVHPNPEVRRTAYQMLRHPRIRLMAPAPYLDFLDLMRRAHFIVTDSGGLQEEAASFHKPVLILRKVTERPEIIQVGGGRLLGTDPKRIEREVSRLLQDASLHGRMSRCGNPYGDGRASERIVAAVKYWFGKGRRPADWRPRLAKP